MREIRTHAIVLRHANYGEANRMLTLLSPTMGLLSVSVKGCRRPTSKLLAATELFTVGEYMLYQRGERHSLTGFSLEETYYPLRTDFDRLAHGAYWLSLCEAAAQPGEESPRLFKMLLLSLAVLAYGDVPLRGLTAVFLTQFAGLLGFAPRLDVCVRCGAPLLGSLRYDVDLGGALCGACAYGSHAMHPQTLAFLREALQTGAFMLAGKQPLPEAGAATVDEALSLMRAHVEHRLDKQIVTARFI